jgi:hypothetical protein
MGGAKKFIPSPRKHFDVAQTDEAGHVRIFNGKNGLGSQDDGDD